MTLSQDTLAMLRNALSHNLAQMRIMGRDVRRYTNYCEKVLISKGVDKIEVKRLMSYVKLQSRKEAKIILDMYQHHGIRLNAQGDGGSEIRFEIILDQIIAVTEQAATREDSDK